MLLILILIVNCHLSKSKKILWKSVVDTIIIFFTQIYSNCVCKNIDKVFFQISLNESSSI